MKLHELRPNRGAKKARKRVGRGIAAGQGKTAGRGTKGQGARSGGGTRLYHQGGNLPFFRRLPFKRGFTPPYRVEYNEVNLERLADFPAESEITPQVLADMGIVSEPKRPVVILGRGEGSKFDDFYRAASGFDFGPRSLRHAVSLDFQRHRHLASA